MSWCKWRETKWQLDLFHTQIHVCEQDKSTPPPPIYTPPQVDLSLRHKYTCVCVCVGLGGTNLTLLLVWIWDLNLVPMTVVSSFVIWIQTYDHDCLFTKSTRHTIMGWEDSSRPQQCSRRSVCLGCIEYKIMATHVLKANQEYYSSQYYPKWL